MLPAASDDKFRGKCEDRGLLFSYIPNEEDTKDALLVGILGFEPRLGCFTGSCFTEVSVFYAT